MYRNTFDKRSVWFLVASMYPRASRTRLEKLVQLHRARIMYTRVPRYGRTTHCTAGTRNQGLFNVRASTRLDNVVEFRIKDHEITN
jgi:hypothetical protein